MELLKNYAFSFIGKPYHWGGDDPINGFDCSGFVQEILAAFGLDPKGDQTAQALFEAFRNSPDQKGVGALAFYGANIDRITHVTIMVNDWQAIGANGGGSGTLSTTDAARDNAFIKLRPVNYRSDLVAVRMPNYRSS